MKNAYQQPVDAVLASLQSDQELGLGGKTAAKRLKRYGKNTLPRARVKTTALKIFFNQWKSPLLIILFVAGAVSGILGEYTDMAVIFFTAFVNAIIGFAQENKANRSLEKLQEMVAYKAIVLRDGEKQEIDSQDVVPGDILFLEAGDKIQADGRLIEAVDFEVHEAALTGEAESIKKNTNKITRDRGVADRTNMVYRGTVATNGHATAVVVKTGEETEIGQIATLVKNIKEDQTPLQEQLGSLSKKIGIIIVVVSLAIFFLGLLSGSDATVFELFETAIAVAVAAIPEGLIISLTVILAVGMQFILKRKAIARRLVSAETLGSVSMICTDKTGTITEGRMHVTQLVTKTENIKGSRIATLDIRSEKNTDAILALRIGVLANNASYRKNHNTQDRDGNETAFVGDSTETAIADAARHIGLEKRSLEKIIPRVGEIPFDSEKKYMATLHRGQEGMVIYEKGAPEVVLSHATFFVDGGQKKRLTADDRIWFERQERRLTEQGLRVLAVAYRFQDPKKRRISQEDINEMAIVGLVAMSDPVREDVRDTIQKTNAAGIGVMMVTGDHARTAQAIAKQIGLPADEENIIGGETLANMTDAQLQKRVRTAHIFARVNPKDKVRIVDALKANGEVVAMTGDGVNDAPALKSADIGVAVGSATDVAKEIADLVILDNRFTTIVLAVEQGRTIYQNIKKVILYLLSGSFAEVVLITGSLVVGLPLALVPVQILWVNLIEDSFPNMALAFDKGERENMQEPPRKKEESIIDQEMKVMIAIISIVSNIVLFGLFLYFFRTTGDIRLTRTIIFLGLGIDSLLFIFSIRSMRHMIWQMNHFTNRYILYSVTLGLVLLAGGIYIPFLQTLLQTVPLGWNHWAVMGLFGLLNIFLIEVVKGFFLVKKHRKVLSISS